MNIHFEKASKNHQEEICCWLKMEEFWQNSREIKQDLINFINGQEKSIHYYNGLYAYWVGLVENKLYCLIMTLKEKPECDFPELQRNYLSKQGKTYRLEFFISNETLADKKLSVQLVVQFTHFFRRVVDKKANTFFIHSDVNSPKICHIYEEAGFQYINDFVIESDGVFTERRCHFLVKQLSPKLSIIKATINDYPTIQNMARFYVYDRTRFTHWECPENGLFECMDFKHYFENPAELAFLIKVGDELAGFVLLDKFSFIEPVDWNMGEFFILAKFQGKGIAQQVAEWIFKKYPGKWSVGIMYENKKAFKFWHKIVARVSHDSFTETHKTAAELKAKDNPDPYALIIFCFDNS